MSDCHPITGDSIKHRVRWQTGDVLPADVESVRLEFLVKGSPSDGLYSFQLRTD